LPGLARALMHTYPPDSEVAEEPSVENAAVAATFFAPGLDPLTVLADGFSQWLAGNAVRVEGPREFGDIVVFELAKEQVGADGIKDLIKRVIGLPGDTVECCNDFGQLLVNGVPLEEPYIKLSSGMTKATRDDFDVTVPEGYLWVMGDNRYNSADSSFHRNDPSGGFVPIDNVVGRALLISWPVDRWTWLDNYPLTFQGVEEAPGG